MSQQMSSGQTTGSYRPRCGVIGTGEEGGALIKKLTQHGIDVRMANAGDSQTLAQLERETGAKAVSIEDAIKDAEIVFLCVPLNAVPDLPKQAFAQAPETTIVVDCCNYYPHRDGSIQEIEQGMPESAWVKRQIGKDVVKAFNSILAGALLQCGRPKGSENRVALPISGDDEKAKEKVSMLMSELGFDSFDAGELSHSWKQQPGSQIYCTNLTKPELSSALSKVSKEEMPKLRDQAYHKMKQSGKDWDWQSLVNMLRETYGVSQGKENQQMGMTATSAEAIST